MQVATDGDATLFGTEMHRRQRATHDDLTGLPNRALLLDRLSSALQSAERWQLSLGLLFVDLGACRHLNAAFDQATAGAVLCELSQRLRSAVRSEDTVARYGGDEFVLLVPGLSGAQGLVRVTTQVHAALERPFALGTRRRIRLTASVGVAIYPDDGCDEDALLRKADANGKVRSDAARGRTLRLHKWAKSSRVEQAP